MAKSTTFKQHTYVPNEFYDYLARIEAGLSGDMSITVALAEDGTSAAVIAALVAAGKKYENTITVTLQDSDHNTLTWFDGTLPIAVTATTAGDGTAAVKGGATTVTFVNGVATAVIEYDKTWAAADTCKVEISAANAGEILGYAITAASDTDTCVA